VEKGQKKIMHKKTLRLDDFALSLSSRQSPPETKMPLSARY